MELFQDFFQFIARDYLQYSILQRMLLSYLLVGLACSLLSVFVVLRNMAFIGQGISHTAFAGLSLGLMLYPTLDSPTLRIYGIALGFCLLAGGLMAWISRKKIINEDTAIGIFYAAGLAGGLIFLSLREYQTTQIFQFLFGSGLVVDRLEVYLIGGTTLLVILAIMLYYKELFVFCFDADFTRILGISNGFLHYLLFFLLTVTVVFSIKIVGVLLVSAFLILPGACAKLITHHFGKMMVVSLMLGIVTTIAGVVAANIIDFISPSALIATIQFVLFIILFFFYRLHSFWKRTG